MINSNKNPSSKSSGLQSGHQTDKPENVNWNYIAFAVFNVTKFHKYTKIKQYRV